jgi:hypothetical protein
MSTVREILVEIEKLPPREFERLRARIDRIAERIWQKEHDRMSRKFRQAGLTDDDVDRFILQRRRRRGAE